MSAHVSITIRQLHPAIKRKLKARAAANGRSMEEEAREILRAALASEPRLETGTEYVERVRSRFAAIGYADDLVVPPREGPGREPPDFNDPVFDR